MSDLHTSFSALSKAIKLVWQLMSSDGKYDKMKFDFMLPV